MPNRLTQSEEELKKAKAQQAWLSSIGGGTGTSTGTRSGGKSYQAGAAVSNTANAAQSVSTNQDRLRLDNLAQSAMASLDLGLENTPEVIAGGTARSLTERRRKRKGVASTVASSLGVV